jgi:hypothetical protein
MLNNCPVCSSVALISPIFSTVNQPLARYGLCDSQKKSIEVKRYPINIYACQNCGVMFNKSFDYKLVDYTSENVQESRVFSPRIHSYMSKKFKELNSNIDLKGEEVLEIGCGEGFFLSKFNENSAVYGFEPSTEGDDAIKLGVNVIPDYYDPVRRDYKLKPKLIILRQVLEHLQQPKIFFDSFAEMLKKNNEVGYMYIEVPSSNTTLKHDRFYDFYFEHYLYFTTASLALLAERAGFIVKYCREEFDNEIISMLCEVRKNNENISSNLDKKLNKIKNLVNDFILKNKKVVAWGAAGTGASLLNMCDFDHKIIPYVIDSDQRKQGLYVPGTGQLVVHPEFFSDSPPDVVLILSQFHKKDIIDQISQIYGENIQIILPDE